MQAETVSLPQRQRSQAQPRARRRGALRVADCMSTTVRTLPASATLREVASRLAAFRIGCVVVTQDERAEGIVTERDIVRLAAAEPEAWATMVAGTVMSRPLWTVQPDARIELAVAALAQHRIRRLVVVGPDARLVGIITQTDLLRAAQHQLDDFAGDLERLVAAHEQEASSTELISLAVHDIKNSVGAIEAAREMLDENPADAPSVLPLLGRATARIGNLACTLLALNRLEHGAMPLRIADVAWSAMRSAVLEEVLLLARTGSIALRPTGDANAILRCDQELIERVLLNLLDNAINAAPAATTIDVHGQRADDGGFLIRVGNRGAVIPREYLPAVFERYQRGTAPGRRGGWGLGLAFCRLAIERHGGTIRAISPWVDDEGVAFEIALPAEPGEQAEA
jgi:signal transduction histidine kinase